MVVFNFICAAIKIYDIFDITAVVNIITNTNKYVKTLKSFKKNANLVQFAAEPVALLEGGS